MNTLLMMMMMMMMEWMEMTIFDGSVTVTFNVTYFDVFE